MAIPAMALPLGDEDDDEDTEEVVGEGVSVVVGTVVTVDEGISAVVGTVVTVDEVVSGVVEMEVVCVAAMRVCGSKDQELAPGSAEESDEYVKSRVVELMLRRRSRALAQQICI